LYLVYIDFQANAVDQAASERAMSWGDENTSFHVVVNDEEQYSIWPDYKVIPAGWRAAGKSGKKDDCLAWIDEVWTDMRPLSLRKAMAADAEQRVASGGQAGGVDR
jgi:MbtH protein